jgi:hypothetical protein
MGKLFKGLTVILLISSSTIAEFITITAVGKVTSVTNAPVTVGTSVEYKFTLDFDSDGYIVKTESIVELQMDNSKQDYFFSDFTDGYVLQDYNVQHNILERNYGYRYIDGSGCYLFGGSSSHPIRLSIPGQIDLLTTGSKISGQEASKRNDNTFELIKFNLELTGVSNVPESSILSLLGFALLFFIPEVCKLKKVKGSQIQ